MKQKHIINISLILFLFSISLLSNCKEEETKPLELGQTHEGGIIFFIEDNGKHGLIAASTDQHTNIQWCTGSCLATNATATALGTGKTNTQTIVSINKTGNHAAAICDKLVHNGFDDWFLPSKDELNFLFIQKEAGRIGNFLAEEYWSSTEDDKDRAWHQHMGNGSTHNEVKVNAACIRAIRAF
ncbi:MAG: DUF1566 domain-containing protein [Bacteroidetes bacterium]|nr:DUF1566 domain-containing protein [Bacteroidota bacterium]